MAENNPEFWIFIGPNGSGKSTLTKKFIGKGIVPDNFINADDMKKDLKISDQEAQTKAAKDCQEAIKNKESFAFETVGSHESKAELMQQAKDNGFEVNLVFVTTQDPEINVMRVNKRVKAGGHDVPKDKIISRYERSMDLLKKEFQIADKAWVYNNSLENPILIGRKSKDGNVILQTDENLKWTQKDLENLVGLDNKKAIGSLMASLIQTKER